MNILRHLLILSIFLVIGCKTVNRARHAQSSADRLPGETSVTAAQIGLSAERSFSLPELERLALEHHPALLSARQAVESARMQLRMTHAGRLPQLAASAAYNRSTQNTWGRSTSSEARGTWSAGVGLDLLLYDFGRLDAAERQGIEDLIAAEQNLLDTELETVYAVRAAFFECHRSVHLMRVAVESERQYAQHLEEARIMTEVGTRRQYDVTKAEVDWGNARLEAVTASNNLVVAHAQLNRALGLAENPDYRIEPGELPYARRHPDALLADARFNAPSLAVLRARERAASAYVDQTIADLYPEFSLGADADLSGRGFPFVWNLSGALRTAQNLFDGHRKTARIDEAVTQLRRARAAVAEAEQTLSLNLVTAVAERESARKRADIARLIQRQAEDNLAIVNEQYRVGISSSIERTDAQVALTQAQANVIRAAYDEQAAIARIARLTGEPVTR
ncbi:MAG TPA: TolC family protein [Kiritimatiellia bacterium]|mgnify:FL=1|nr:TolC family protein [Kiritimatiellia bacterium]HRU71712.1 TolC family protein [Kiritimatiellia bacterium]